MVERAEQGVKGVATWEVVGGEDWVERAVGGRIHREGPVGVVAGVEAAEAAVGRVAAAAAAGWGVT